MGNTEEGNQTTIREFILLGFGNLPELQPFLFSLFLMIYILTLTGNFLIISLVVADQHLHTPMYFFLANLSCLETFSSSITLPKMLVNLITEERTISLNGCFTQFYFFASCAAIETYLLAIMSYDRYVAICRPLLYAAIMNRKLCFQLIVAIWVNGPLIICIVIYLLAQINFCGPNVIDHYFCDLIPMEKLSCSDTRILEFFILISTFFSTVIPFLLILTPYVCIISTILKIPSAIGRQKAFLTCSSHLTVVCTFYGSIIIVYMLPDTPKLRDLNKVFSLFYTILNPLINPLIYSLRNKEVHKAFKFVCGRLTVYVRLYTSFPL